MADGLFRKEAYDNYSSMVKVDKAIKTVRHKNFIMAAIIIAMLIAVVIWFVAGNITETVSIDGIVTTDGGRVGIYAENAGKVSDVFIWNGADVKADDVIAVVPNEEKLAEIENLKKSGAAADTIEKARNDYYSSSFIRSIKSGVIRSVVSDGQYVNIGDTIAEMSVVEDYANNSKILAFIPSHKVQSLKTGMEVQVSPDFAAREEYGYIKGYISSIDSYPKTAENIIKEYGIDALKNILDDTTIYMSVEVTMIPDSSSVSYVKWSNPQGNSLNVDVGTICTGLVVVQRCKPYEWFFK